MSNRTPFCSYFKGEQGCDKCVGNTGYVSEGFTSHKNCNCAPPAPKYGKNDYVKTEFRDISFEPQGRQTYSVAGRHEFNFAEGTEVVELCVFVEYPGSMPETKEFEGSYSFGIDTSVCEQHELEKNDVCALEASVDYESIVATAYVYHIFPDGSESYAGVKSEVMEVVYEESIRWQVIYL